MPAARGSQSPPGRARRAPEPAGGAGRAPHPPDGVGWVLTSALYLDAKWAKPFRPDKTVPDPFTAPGGQRPRLGHGDRRAAVPRAGR